MNFFKPQDPEPVPDLKLFAIQIKIGTGTYIMNTVWNGSATVVKSPNAPRYHFIAHVKAFPSFVLTSFPAAALRLSELKAAQPFVCKIRAPIFALLF